MSKKNKSIITITVIIILMLITQIIYYVGYAIKYNKKFDYVDSRINQAEYRLDLIESRVDKIEKEI